MRHRDPVAGCVLGLAFVVSIVSLSGQSGTPAVRSAPPTAETTQTLLDRYCVTCHNDRLKTANLSLQGLDLATVPDHAELWEKVIRKLRAGVMPPPDLPRPPLAEYEGLRDWLEAEIDRVAATRTNAGSVVLHRLNRTEYATPSAISSTCRSM